MNATNTRTRSVVVVGAASDRIDAVVERFETAPATQVARMDLGALDSSAIDELKSVDVLILDASDDLEVAALDVDRAQIDASVGRLADAFSWCQAAGRGMCQRGEGAIVVIGTVDGYHSESGGALRSTSQAALLGLVQGLGIEWAPLGVRVVGAAYSRPVDVEGARAPAIGHHPTAAEVASAVEFLAGEDASYVVAETIRVDGGYVAYQMF
jgi:3-oxoacyl-[acyl-carrier protein] reductase